jgi:tetratricopeptide (TPR) repeat protein
MNDAANKRNNASLPISGGGVEVSAVASVGCESRPQHWPGSQAVKQTSQKLLIQSPGHQAPPCPGLVCPPRAVTQSAKHSSKLAINNLIRFILNSSFQTEMVARRLIELAESAYHARQSDALEVVANSLSLTPQYRAVACFYRGLAVMMRESKDTARAKELFAHTISHAPIIYQSRALLELSAVAECEQDTQSEFDFCKAALKSKHDSFTLIEAHRAIAIIQSREGDHRRAAEHLLSLWPVVSNCAVPRLQADYLNSLAVELGELGDIERAIRFSELALSSPYAQVCPEYAETRAELRQLEPQARALQAAAPKNQNGPLPDSELDHSEPIPLNFICERIADTPLTPRALTLARISARVIKSNPPTGPPVLS